MKIFEVSVITNKQSRSWVYPCWVYDCFRYGAVPSATYQNDCSDRVDSLLYYSLLERIRHEHRHIQIYYENF